MPRIDELQNLAQTENYDLSNPLSNEEVEMLLQYWLPQIYFHPAERFHPIGNEDAFTMITSNYEQLPPNAQEEFKVSSVVRLNGQAGEIRQFDPPIIKVPDGVVSSIQGLPGVTQPTSAFRVIGFGSGARSALDLEQLEGNGGEQSATRITHGASYRRSNHFFGATNTLSSAGAGTVGDPLLPRLQSPPDTPGALTDSLIRVIATFKNVLDAFDFELAYEEAELSNRDGLRGGLNILNLLFINKGGQGVPLNRATRRTLAREMVQLHRNGESLQSVIEQLPFGWGINEHTWDAITRFAFAEYYFFYAYNDWNNHEDSPFTNEHEGDDEGCCLIFDRNTLNAARSSGDAQAIRHAVPYAIATSVHTEFQHADRFRHIPVPIPQINNPNWLPRDDVEIKVYVAADSHATYLTPGNHNLVDFDDVTGFISENAGKTLIVLGIAALIPFGLTALVALAVILAAAEHFIDTEDHTSDEGIEAGPEELTESSMFGVTTELDFFPTARDKHVYQTTQSAILEGASFPGYWGGHDGLIDKSPKFVPKTGRYFRKILDNN